MNNISSYLFGATLALASPNTEAAIHQNPPPSSQTNTGPDYQEICENQSLIIMRELLPHIKLRAHAILAQGLESLEVTLRPDPNWPAQYVQNQVAHYVGGEKEVVELWKFSLSFPNPFLDYSLRYWRSGKYELEATCKYPLEK